MSKSYRKPFWKDKSDHTWYNRIFRRVNKQLLKEEKELKQMRELVNDWDVCDWKWYNPDDKYLYRK